MAARGLVSVTVISNVQRAGSSNLQSAPNDPTGPGPATYTNGIPAGFARSQQGATAAAAAYVLTGQVLLGLPTTTLDEAVRAISSTASASVQVSTIAQQLDQLRAVLAPGTGPTRYLQAVLATRLDTFTPDRASVSVWSVGVLSRLGVAAPQAGWSTSVFDLVWERDDWKVATETITAGPAPALNDGTTPATSEDLAAALDGFVPWGQSR